MSGFETMPQPIGLFAGDLFQRAAQFIEAFEILICSKRPPEFAAYFLFAHSLELLLKSYLAANGVKKHEIEKKLKHDLWRILTQCETRSLALDTDVIAFIRHTYEMNQTHDFRYPTGYHLSMPRLSECLAIARRLERQIQPVVSAAAGKAAVEFAAQTRHLKGKKIRWSD